MFDTMNNQPSVNTKELIAIKARIISGKATIQDLVNGVKSDSYLFFNALMDNNLNDVNVTLRKDLGYEKQLPFTPDRKKIQFIIDGLIQNKNTKALQTIINEFDYNPKANNYTTNQNFVSLFNGSSSGARLDFSGGATEIGTGIGGFLSPIFNSLGTSTTTTQNTTSKIGTTTVLAVMGVLVVIVGSIYFLFLIQNQTPLKNVKR